VALFQLEGERLKGVIGHEHVLLAGIVLFLPVGREDGLDGIAAFVQLQFKALPQLGGAVAFALAVDKDLRPARFGGDAQHAELVGNLGKRLAGPTANRVRRPTIRPAGRRRQAENALKETLHSSSHFLSILQTVRSCQNNAQPALRPSASTRCAYHA
jgi:hypothetical protein